MFELTYVEREALTWLLAGELPELETLRRQAGDAVVVGRDLSPYGFYARLRVSAASPRLGRMSFALRDVLAEIPGLNSPVGFVLFGEDGEIRMLEGYTIDDRWPERVIEARFFYRAGPAGRREGLDVLLRGFA